jgi:IclR family acetate operon transcriptional repressor
LETTYDDGAYFMTTGLIGRAFGILEQLVNEPGGLGVQALADQRGMPLASAHRLLGELAQLGYVRQIRDNQKYMLTTKLISLGFRCLSTNGIVNFAQPVLDSLASASKELVRLAIVDGIRLTWVAKAQGAGSGLRYDPDMGQEAALFCTASGHAWLSSLSDEEALRIVVNQGFGKLNEYGPNAPRSTSALIKRLRETRTRGYAIVTDSGSVGTAAMAAAVVHAVSGAVIGTVSIAGPSARLNSTSIADLAPALLSAAADLSAACQFVDFFQPVDNSPSKVLA